MCIVVAVSWMRHQPTFWPFWPLHILQVCHFSSCICWLLQSSVCSDFVLFSCLRCQVHPKPRHLVLSVCHQWRIWPSVSCADSTELCHCQYTLWHRCPHGEVLWGHGDGQDLWRWADSSWERGEGATRSEGSPPSALNKRCYKKGTRLQYPSSALLSAVPGSNANLARANDLAGAKGAAPAAQPLWFCTGPLWRDARAWAVPGLPEEAANSCVLSLGRRRIVRFAKERKSLQSRGLILSHNTHPRAVLQKATCQ